MKSILKISKERISNTFLSLNLGEVVMKKLNVFELKQVSGGASIAPIAKFPKDLKDFVVPGARVPEDSIGWYFGYPDKELGVPRYPGFLWKS